MRDSGLIGHLLNKSVGKPSVLADITKLDSHDYRASYLEAMAAHADDSAERAFLEWVRADVCVPLAIKDRALAGIIAVRGAAYTEAEADSIRRELEGTQELLAALYYAGLRLSRKEQSNSILHAVSRAFTEFPSSPTDTLLFKKAASVFTNWEGPRWQRVFFFRFERPDTAARCVMAVGGFGDWAWDGWRNRFGHRPCSLSESLKAASKAKCFASDPLFQLIQQDQDAILIVGNDLAAGTPIHSLLSESDRGRSGIELSADDPWLRSLAGFERAFAKHAWECPHYIFPLLHPGSGSPLGFVLLDNPYPHPIEKSIRLGLTSLVCEFLSLSLAIRNGSSPIIPGRISKTAIDEAFGDLDIVPD